MLIALIALNILQLLVLLYIVYVSQKERETLLDRIMAKDYIEFVDNQKPEDNDFSDGSEQFLDLEDAKKEITKG
jgi:hypothetical protein